HRGRGAQRRHGPGARFVYDDEAATAAAVAAPVEVPTDLRPQIYEAATRADDEAGPGGAIR
ncbi:MAG: hypothetical protein VX911_06185, partial [Candidatus Latescibacterota bacterium]|nr:hypothetical protein [Candidatus Latescibacterota bacterium]